MFKINTKSFKTKQVSTLITNFFSLVLLQVLNVVLPFLTIPYLIRTVGLEKFGLLTFVHSFVLFLVIFVEYGFNISTTRELSICSDDKKEVQRIYSEVLSAKLFLLLVCFFVFSVVVFCFDRFRENALIYFLYFGIVVGQTLFSLWLFQGLQKMKYVSYINVFFKTIFTVCIFIFVKGVPDIWMVPLFLSAGAVFSGIASLVVIRFVLDIHYTLPKFEAITGQLKTGYHLFMSEFYMAVLTFSNVLILGFVSGNQSVGIYSAAEKVIRAAASLLSPVINTLYPHVSKLVNEDYKQGMAFIEKAKKWGVLIIIFGTVFVFVFADLLFDIIYKNKDVANLEQSVLVFRIMIVFPLVSFLDQVYGKLVLIVLGRADIFFKIFSACAVFNLILCAVLSYYFNYLGTASSSIISQIIIAFLMYYYASGVQKKYLQQ
ncbi:oligosaccharide flippase family protein [Flavobacterium sp. SM15]|nr:oligosaccharide flippase family protein [Flavobacterium sp. SM15]MCG2610369.1 oligosaccharide flippase family protein [Flavobacterium sp. SM15]